MEESAPLHPPLPGEPDFAMSAECGELFAALSRLQSEVATAKKGGKNPHFRSHFTRMEDAVLAVQEHLNGLCVLQFRGRIEDGMLPLRTVLGHSSGQWIASVSTTPVPKEDPQGVGSVTTYARRYDYLAVLGLAPSDDDGEGAMRREEPQKRPAARRQPPDPPKPEPKKPEPAASKMGEEMRSKLNSAMKAAGMGVAAASKLALEVCKKAPADCTDEDARALLDHLEAQS